LLRQFICGCHLEPALIVCGEAALIYVWVRQKTENFPVPSGQFYCNDEQRNSVPSWNRIFLEKLTAMEFVLSQFKALHTVTACLLTLSLLMPYIYRVSQEECARLRESVPYVKLYRYNPKHLCPKLNGYGYNGHRKGLSSCGSMYCTSYVMQYPSLRSPIIRERVLASSA
jgi:hypothetical protein